MHNCGFLYASCVYMSSMCAFRPTLETVCGLNSNSIVKVLDCAVVDVDVNSGGIDPVRVERKRGPSFFSQLSMLAQECLSTKSVRLHMMNTTNHTSTHKATPFASRRSPKS